MDKKSKKIKITLSVISFIILIFLMINCLFDFIYFIRMWDKHVHALGFNKFALYVDVVAVICASILIIVLNLIMWFDKKIFRTISLDDIK